MRFNRIKETRMNDYRQPVLGKIKLGVKLKTDGGVEYPKETDYFVVPVIVQLVHGEKPKELPCMFVVEDEFEAVRQYYAVYGKDRKLKCMGDGEKAERRTETGPEQITCPAPEHCDFAKKQGCKSTTELSVVLPNVNMGGVYRLTTRSQTAGSEIRAGLTRAKEIFGRISWVPMLLVREERKMMNPVTKKMETHWPPKLYPVADAAETVRIRKDTERVLGYLPQLTGPDPAVTDVVDGAFTVCEDESEVKTERVSKVQAGIFSLRLEACKTIHALNAVGAEIKAAAQKLIPKHLEELKTDFRQVREIIQKGADSNDHNG